MRITRQSKVSGETNTLDLPVTFRLGIASSSRPGSPARSGTRCSRPRTRRSHDDALRSSGSLSRPSVLGPILVVVASRVPAAASDGILPAIRWAEAADAAYAGSGRIGADRAKAGLPMPAGWTAYRASLAHVRRLPRLELYALTPATPERAAALAAYHTARGERAGSSGARRAARRRLRKVFARPGAELPQRPT